MEQSCCENFSDPEQIFEIDSRLESHRLQHEHEILGNDISARSSREGSIANAAQSAASNVVMPSSSPARTLARPSPGVLLTWSVVIC